MSWTSASSPPPIENGILVEGSLLASRASYDWSMREEGRKLMAPCLTDVSELLYAGESRMRVEPTTTLISRWREAEELAVYAILVRIETRGDILRADSQLSVKR